MTVIDEGRQTSLRNGKMSGTVGFLNSGGREQESHKCWDSGNSKGTSHAGNVRSGKKMDGASNLPIRTMH